MGFHETVMQKLFQFHLIRVRLNFLLPCACGWSSARAPMHFILHGRFFLRGPETQLTLPSSTGLFLKALPRLCEYGVKNSVLLPAVDKQNATYSSNFTQPGKSLFLQPCRPQPPPSLLRFMLITWTVSLIVVHRASRWPEIHLY